MSVGANVAIAAAVAAAQAIKANGVIVRVEPQEFAMILKRVADPLVVTAKVGLWKHYHQYLTSYKGLAFFTSSPEPLDLHAGVELVRAGSISIPG